MILKDYICSMNELKPKVYIETKWEFIEGYRYEQPVKYCNGVELTVEVIENFETIFKIPFGEVLKTSNSYDRALDASLYYSELWTDESVKNKAFSKIYEYILVKTAATGSITPLFPFELYLLNDGFELAYFSELNAYAPYRRYEKEDKIVSISFGITIRGKKTNFYFELPKEDNYFYYQLDNEYSNYKKAIEGKLKPLNP